MTSHWSEVDDQIRETHRELTSLAKKYGVKQQEYQRVMQAISTLRDSLGNQMNTVAWITGRALAVSQMETAKNDAEVKAAAEKCREVGVDVATASDFDTLILGYFHQQLERLDQAAKDLTAVLNGLEETIQFEVHSRLDLAPDDISNSISDQHDLLNRLADQVNEMRLSSVKRRDAFRARWQQSRREALAMGVPVHGTWLEVNAQADGEDVFPKRALIKLSTTGDDKDQLGEVEEMVLHLGDPKFADVCREMVQPLSQDQIRALVTGGQLTTSTTATGGASQSAAFTFPGFAPPPVATSTGFNFNPTTATSVGGGGFSFGQPAGTTASGFGTLGGGTSRRKK